MDKCLVLLCLVSGVSLGVRGQRQAATPLGRLNVHHDWITLSGFSSGGTFAQQLQISYSSLFTGIAVFSHTYYRCSPGDGIQENYDNLCTTIGNFSNDQLWKPEQALADIQLYYQRGLIENPANIKDTLLYVYAGTRNWLFTTDQSLRILNIYEPLIQNTCNIKTRIQNANLTLPSDRFGGSCSADASSNFFISNCGLSGAFDALNFLLGDAFQRFAAPAQAIRLQPLQTFDQTEFFGPTRHDMDDVGFIYVPSKCLFGTCFLHLYFHGCLTGRELVGESHIRNSGYLEVAELNNVILVFPQAKSSLPQNEIGCWDTYGLTGPLYATQQGAQVGVVRRILARILGQEHLVQQHQGQQPLQSNFLAAAQSQGPIFPSQSFVSNTLYGK